MGHWLNTLDTLQKTTVEFLKRQKMQKEISYTLSWAAFLSRMQLEAAYSLEHKWEIIVSNSSILASEITRQGKALAVKTWQAFSLQVPRWKERTKLWILFSDLHSHSVAQTHTIHTITHHFFHSNMCFKVPVLSQPRTWGHLKLFCCFPGQWKRTWVIGLYCSPQTSTFWGPAPKSTTRDSNLQFPSLKY